MLFLLYGDGLAAWEKEKNEILSCGFIWYIFYYDIKLLQRINKKLYFRFAYFVKQTNELKTSSLALLHCSHYKMIKPI